MAMATAGPLPSDIQPVANETRDRIITGLGITVGFHRHLTHRAFKAKPWLHGLLGILGSAAIEGPVISWVADHRKHHAFSDETGDPHSPHVDHGHGWSGAMRGLFHAPMGWIF